MDKILSSEDYCPHCKKWTKGLKDFDRNEYLCKRCGKFSVLNRIETMGINTSPTKLKNDFMTSFKKRII